MKHYIIQIGTKTFYRYGGNTRDAAKALVFDESELHVANTIVTRLVASGKTAALIERGKYVSVT